jgi:L-2-hydroxyglutarate oxidase
VIFDCVIVGGGIIGLSTAWQLSQRYPDKKLLLFEKEHQYALHQTGHNSGVIHAGVYYQPGSLKARFCKQGVEGTIAFCRQHQIPYEQCGKLLVATNAIEYRRMQDLHKRCRQNEIEAEWLSADALRQHEPNIVGVGAIFVPSTGIVDYRLVAGKMADEFNTRGGKCELDCEVIDIEESAGNIRVTTSKGDYSTRFLICCSGLMADRLVKTHGLKADFQIIPFRGEYYQLPAHRNDIIKHLIYPIPDPDLPFLGVHITRMIDGSVTVGPNAVLGWKREGYGVVNFSLRDSMEMLGFPGFWRVLGANLKSGVAEFKNSLCKKGYLALVRKYCPQLTSEDLLPYPAGIRAQAVLADGCLVHDFLFKETPRVLHVCNAPSPAATSSIPIGNYICDKIAQRIE